VVDLSADFRLSDVEVYKKWYGTEHKAPELQKVMMMMMTTTTMMMMMMMMMMVVVAMTVWRLSGNEQCAIPLYSAPLTFPVELQLEIQLELQLELRLDVGLTVRMVSGVT
jgi:hypothetical protein